MAVNLPPHYHDADARYKKAQTAADKLSALREMWVLLPKHKASVGAQYELTLANGSSITPRVDGSFQSELYTNGNNQLTNRIGGYTLFNARLTWKNADGDLEAALEGTNLGDKYYYVSRADQYTGAGHTDGAPGRPREWALTIKKRF